MKFLILCILGFPLVKCVDPKQKISEEKKNDSSAIIKRPANKIEVDSLRKYSYLLVGLIKNEVKGLGTGFFVRKNNKIFFGSAGHLFSRFDVFKRINIIDWDSVAIRYYDTALKDMQFYVLHTHVLKTQIPRVSFMEYPDFVFFPIDIPNSFIYSIESFIDYSGENGANNDSAYAFGFIPRNRTDTVNVKKLEAHLYSVKRNDSAVRDPEYTKFDILNSLYTPQTNEGVSGAPIFVLHRTKDTSYFTFGGVAFGRDSIRNYSYFVKETIAERYMLESK